jgi:transcriptional regulator with XRE-family HTH domain
MIERIQQLIDEKQLTLSSFASETGINPTTISHIIKGREIEGKGKINQTPSTEVITKILSTYKDINAEWLLMGIGPMHKSFRARIQPDLFAERAIEPPVPPAAPEYRPEIEDIPVEKTIQPTQQQAIMPELSLSENIDKIVIFFKNKTYVTLKPEE